ncbi:MAG: hypothetical protein RBU37_13590 [Myxococcota bacterium]|jgi:hypothetical protein|nr:hypothetical protein [Myxococcota bacterium]
MARDDERERKSWREIDAERNRSRHVSREPSPGAKASSKRNLSKGQVEAIFDSGKLGELFADKLIDDTTEEGQRAKRQAQLAKADDASFPKLLADFIAEYDTPERLDVLVRGVALDNFSLVRRCVQGLLRAARDGEEIPKKAVLLQQLRSAELLFDDPKLEALTRELSELLR